MKTIDWLEAHKPAASTRTHLLLAALLWIGVGTMLSWWAADWLLSLQERYKWFLIGAALVLGILKARFVLTRIAGGIVRRIEMRGDGRCLGGFLSVRSWLIIILMMGAGRLLRGGPMPRSICGLIYGAVGTALILASLPVWNAWYHYRESAGP